MRLHVPIALRWADLDAYGHVNNAVMFRLLEEARIQAFWHPGSAEVAGASTAVIDSRPGTDTLTLIARQEIEYLEAVPYLRQPIDVQLWISLLGGASLDVCYEVYGPSSEPQAVLYARASTTIVLVDAASGRPREIRDNERAAWTPYLDDPVVFKRR